MAPHKWLPPKYFYDERGSLLFDAICDLPEYYLTRSEQALLEQVADEVVALARPAELLELGSGASRKTRLLLDAISRAGLPLRYSPFDVSEPMLRDSSAALLAAYPRLTIDAFVGDYERHLRHLPMTPHRLFTFLGSTIGNFDPAQTMRFLDTLRRQCSRGDNLLIGVDLVKPVAVIEAAYNDSAGLTAEFNRNVLRVLNRELGASFDLQRFDHVAFFDRERSQIEMHLRARGAQRVLIRALELAIDLEDGETIHTEISRKFTRSGLEVSLRAAGFALERWFESTDASFALVLAKAQAD